jgi:hypothetical protein
MTPSAPADFTALDTLKARPDALRPLPPAAVRNLPDEHVLGLPP